MTAPLISVVLPVRDAAKTVERAARSILQSSFKEIELVVIDDGSTDGSPEIIRKITDSRLRLFQQGKEGICAAANRGTTEAHASVIARMDADDFSHPTRLEKQFELLHRNKVDIVGCQVKIIDIYGQAVASMQRYESWSNALTEPDQIAAMRFVELPIINPTLMAKREVFELSYRQGDWPEDYDLCLRALGKELRAAKVTEVLLDWIDSSKRLTRKDARYSPEAFDRCRRTHLIEGPLKGVKEVDLWGAGQAGKPWLRWLQDKGFHVRHIIEVSPKKIGTKIHEVPVICPHDLPPPEGNPLIIAVGAAGARELIEAELIEKGYTPGENAWFVC